MPFKSILVALDGSECSQVAANSAIWLAEKLGAKLSGQHVVDPRMADFFIAPEFAEELGFRQSIETSEKVHRALKRIGKVILDLFSKEATARGIKTDTFLDVGYTVEEIVKRSDQYDLVVLGHRGRLQKKSPGDLMTGSVAERVTVNADQPVLIAMSPLSSVEQILVAYDGSEPSRGALLAAERLASRTGKRLRAVTVVPSAERMSEARLTVEQGEEFLRGHDREDVFEIHEGHPAKVLMQYADATNSLMYLGAYGYKSPDLTVLGSTASYVVRRTRTSVLVYR